MKTVLIFFLALSTVICESGPKFRKQYSEEQLQTVEQYFAQMDSYDRKSWVDPNDMLAINTVDVGGISETAISAEVVEVQTSETKIASTENSTPPGKYNTVKENSKEVIFATNASADSVYLKRWLKMFLSTVKTNDGGDKVISFPLSDKVLKRVEKLLRLENPNYNIIENALSDILSKVTISEEVSSVSRTVNVIFGKEVLVFLFVFLVGLVMYFVCKDHPKIFYCVIVVLSSIVFQWMKLYREKLATKHAHLEKINFNAACRMKDAGVLDSITLWAKSFFVSHGSCEEYYKALMVDPIWEVTPLMAISATGSQFILYPLEVFAETMNNCMIKLFKDLSYMNTLFLIVFIVLVLMMYCNYRLRLPFFFSFEPGAPHPPQIQNVTSIPHTVHYVVDTRSPSIPLSINNAITSDTFPSDTSAKQIACIQRTETALSSQIDRIVNAVQQTANSELPTTFKNILSFDSVKHGNGTQIVEVNDQKGLYENSTRLKDDSKKEGNIDFKNAVNTECKNEMNAEFEDEMNADCKKRVNTDCTNEIHTDCENEMRTECENEIHTDCENEMHTECENEIHTDCKNKIHSDCENEMHTDTKNEMHMDAKNEMHTDCKSELDIDSKETNGNFQNRRNDDIEKEIDDDFEIGEVEVGFENEVGLGFENEIDVDFEDEMDADFENELELCNESIEICLASLSLDVNRSPDLKLETPRETPVPEDKESCVM